MQKNTHKNTDFFKDFRYAQIQKYLFSGSIAVFAAFSIVSVIHSDIDPRGLMASVAGVTSTVVYDADIVMTREGDMLVLTLGKSAQKVDTIDLILLGDPSRLRTITATTSDTQVIGQPDIGVYHITTSLRGQNIAAGTQITRLSIGADIGAPIVISDTELMSGGVRYSLSNKGE